MGVAACWTHSALISVLCPKAVQSSGQPESRHRPLPHQEGVRSCRKARPEVGGPGYHSAAEGCQDGSLCESHLAISLTRCGLRLRLSRLFSRKEQGRRKKSRGRCCSGQNRAPSARKGTGTARGQGQRVGREQCPPSMGSATRLPLGWNRGVSSPTRAPPPRPP